jgi:hypothetical protein
MMKGLSMSLSKMLISTLKTKKQWTLVCPTWIMLHFRYHEHGEECHAEALKELTLEQMACEHSDL